MKYRVDWVRSLTSLIPLSVLIIVLYVCKESKISFVFTDSISSADRNTVLAKENVALEDDDDDAKENADDDHDWQKGIYQIDSGLK